MIVAYNEKGEEAIENIPQKRRREKCSVIFIDSFQFLPRDHVRRQILGSKKKNSKQFTHTIHTITQRKLALTVWEDKRIWVSSNQSYPYGPHRLPNILLENVASPPHQQNSLIYIYK